jgi:hypothetical protein
MESRPSAVAPVPAVVTVPIGARPETSLDPRTAEISWTALGVRAARAGCVTSTAALAEVVRGFADVLQKTHDPGRAAAFTRIATVRDGSGRMTLRLALGMGILGPVGETSADALDCARIASAVLGRPPSPFTVEPIDPRPLLEPPRHLAAIRQRSVEVVADSGSIEAPSRFDRQLDSWLDLIGILLSRAEPVMLQASFLASSLSLAESLELERRSTTALGLQARAEEDGNPVLARRAERIVLTLIDVAESFSGCLWVGEVVVGSDERLPRTALRALAGAVTNEVDAVHAGQGAPVVAGRNRIVGGSEIVAAAGGVAEALRVGLPSGAFGRRALTDLFSPTEVGHTFRWPIALGDAALPGIPVQGSRAIPAPGGLPPAGLALGRDSEGRRVYLGEEGLTGHALVVGGTGTGKSTAMREMARFQIERDEPFVVVDPHGHLVEAIRADAEAAGRAVALISPTEPSTMALDLLGGALANRADDLRVGQAISRVVDALTSHLPRDWAGPRFRQLATAAMELVVEASADSPVGLREVATVLTDKEYLTLLLAASGTTSAARVMRQHLQDRDHADVGLWASSKFEDIVQSPGASRVFARFGEGVSVGRVIDERLPLLVDLSGLSRLGSALLGQVVLAATVDYALGGERRMRPPFPVFVDEAQRFPAVNLVDALAEGRKFGLRLVLATQDLGRLDEDLRGALLVNTGTKVVFRSSPADARRLAPLLGVPAADLTGLGNLAAFAQVDDLPAFSVALRPPSDIGAVAPYASPARFRAAARAAR